MRKDCVERRGPVCEKNTISINIIHFQFPSSVDKEFNSNKQKNTIVSIPLVLNLIG